MNAVIAMLQGISLIGLLRIILADLALSGDNALVIGAAAAGLKDPKQRKKAIIFGGLCAAVLRIALTVGATLLLRVPLLQAVGAAALIWVALGLLKSEEESDSEQKAHTSFSKALLTIVIAVADIASGNRPTLIIGMALSIGLLMLGGTLIAKLIERLPLLQDLASLVLAWTAGKMLLEDRMLGPVLAHVPFAHLALPITATATVLAADVTMRRRARRAS